MNTSPSDHLSPDAIDLVMEHAFSLLRDSFQQNGADRARVLFRGVRILVPDSVEAPRGETIASLLLEDAPAATDAIEIALARARKNNVDEVKLGELLALSAKANLLGKDFEAARVAAGEVLESLNPHSDAPWVLAFRAGVQSIPADSSRELAPDSTILDATRDLLLAAARGQRPLAHAFGIDDEALLLWYDEGMRLLQSSAFEDAQRVFRGLVALDGSAPLFHFAYAASSELVGEFFTAAASHDRGVIVAADTAPEVHASSLLRRGRFHFSQGDLAAAQIDLDRAVKLSAPKWGEEERAQAYELLEAATRLG